MMDQEGHKFCWNMYNLTIQSNWTKNKPGSSYEENTASIGLRLLEGKINDMDCGTSQKVRYIKQQVNSL